jgi:predicted AlkP superfamily phosphohydrolase/phosphomutase
MSSPVVLLGLDAADADVIDVLTQQGRLSNLRRLREHGLFGRLESPADLYAGGVWPTFYTGRSVDDHGIYHNKLWRAAKMRIDVASDDWLPARPFWESFAGTDLRVCIIDVPMVLGRPRPVNGVHLSGWGTHDLIGRGSWPPDIWQSCVRQVGAPVMPAEHFGRQSERSLEALAGELEAATRQLGTIAVDLMQRDAWDLTCIVFGAIHRAGHYLWDRSQVDAHVRSTETGTITPDLLRVYQQVDEAVGNILPHVPQSALVIAFAVHGMGPNPGWSDLLPDILASMEEHRSGIRPRRGALYALKQRIPFHWVRPLLNGLPISVNHRLVSLWSRRMFDWSSTRYFPMPMDEAGYLRINLRGREADGIVAPGAEYDALCDELAALISSLRDADSARPIAGDIVRAYADAPRDSTARELLPDLVVRWDGPTATATRRLTSSSLAGFEYAVPQRLPSGRSGNHTGQGWFIARGPNVATGAARRSHKVVDLLPTVLQHLGVSLDQTISGTAIDLRVAR